MSQIELDPESVFKMLREARDLLPNEPAGKDAHALLVTLEVTVYHAEQLDSLAEAEIKKIKAAGFNDFTKLQLIGNWIEVKRLAASMINRAMREAIHAAIAIRGANSSALDHSLIKTLEQVLGHKSKKIKIGG